MIANKNELDVEVDMIRGNINRMCLTQDNSELVKMFDYAKLRLQAIYDYNKERVINNVK